MVSLLLPIIYLAFISLGLPDSMLGSAWPSMFAELNVPVSFAGIITVIIASGTVISSLLSNYLTSKIGVGKITLISIALTAAALLGFSLCRSFIIICILAVPYGFGAGSIDAALNNYVALHYESRHMSWLHCMWGVGTMIGPLLMSLALTNDQGWNSGYRYVAYIQFALTVILAISLPLWKKKNVNAVKGLNERINNAKTVSTLSAIRLKGAIEIMIAFFCYCAVEQTSMLWASSYMALHLAITEETAAGLASILFIGITVGRAINGFLTFRFSDTQMIRAGIGIVMLGIIVLFLPFGIAPCLAGLALIGLGCAPIYPCIIHSTPDHFGADNSQAMIGVQMASAYAGSTLMPPLFGLIVSLGNIALLPVYLLILTVIMIIAHELLVRKTTRD